jgi:hypothetical protein
LNPTSFPSSNPKAFPTFAPTTIGFVIINLAAPEIGKKEAL